MQAKPLTIFGNEFPKPLQNADHRLVRSNVDNHTALCVCCSIFTHSRIRKPQKAPTQTDWCSTRALISTNDYRRIHFVSLSFQNDIHCADSTHTGKRAQCTQARNAAFDTTARTKHHNKWVAIRTRRAAQARRQQWKKLFIDTFFPPAKPYDSHSEFHSQ